jgi:hypothetical protein
MGEEGSVEVREEQSVDTDGGDPLDAGLGLSKELFQLEGGTGRTSSEMPHPDPLGRRLLPCRDPGVDVVVERKS